MSQFGKNFIHVISFSNVQNVLRNSEVYVVTRATKSQNFFAVLKVHETFTNQISRSYHEGIPSY